MKIKSIFLYGVWALFSLALSAACSRMELEPSANGEGSVAAEPEKPKKIISITVDNLWGDDASNADNNSGGEQDNPADSANPEQSGNPDASAESEGLEEGTKISYSYDSDNKKLKQGWERGDRLLVYGRNIKDYNYFSCDDVYANGRAHFIGTEPDGDNTSFDIIVLGQNENFSMNSFCFNELTQTRNGDTSHIESYVLLENVNTYWDIHFNSSWASSHGGTLSMNPMIHFHIKVPSDRIPKKIGLISTAVRLIPHYKGGRPVNSIWLNLNGVTPTSNVFDAWMPLPEPLGAGNYAVSVLLDNNYYYLTRDFYSGGFAAGKMYLIQRDLTNADKVASYYAHQRLAYASPPIRTGGSFYYDWQDRIILAHPLMETCTLPANPKYGKLHEARMIADQAWIYGYLEFEMKGWNQSLPLDMVFASETGQASLRGLGNVSGGSDTGWAFTNTNINRFFEIPGLTQPNISYNSGTYNEFNNWRAENRDYGFPGTFDNRFEWYHITGSGSLYNSKVRMYLDTPTEQNPRLDKQLTVDYVQAAGDYGVAGTNIGRLEFRMRRSSLQYNATNANTSFAFGIKLMGNPNYDTSAQTGWYCHGLLPQGGRDDSGNRIVVPMRVVTTPPYGGDTIDAYHNYDYPYTSQEANIVTCYE